MLRAFVAEKVGSHEYLSAAKTVKEQIAKTTETFICSQE